jgi:maltooligosyltrehalose trehalohydrolase
MPTTVLRRFPVGAEPVPGGVHFRVWAPRCQRVEIVFDESHSMPRVALELEEGGYFSAFVEGAKPSLQYRYALDSDEQFYPDPASRFQPEGPHGPSQIVDALLFQWTDQAWRGAELRGQVIYEMHVGTFTREGTWSAAEQRLSQLAETGITLLEIMPVSDFPGEFGWGYDGVAFFAPTRLYGTPDDFRSFVNRAHSLGLGVILDVVYNHVGPDGNYLTKFSDTYFSDRYENEWGDPLNFDGPGNESVREFFVSNACYWIEEFHLDGLRLDATQQIFDASGENIIAQINREVRRAAGRRSVVIMAENEPQESHLARPIEENGYGCDALWNDDFHHSALVAMTGRNEAYYTDYLGNPQEFISAMKWGFLYQGQFYVWQRKRRGSSGLDMDPAAFVNYLENHDQIANTPYGQRPRQMTTPGRFKALTTLLLLGPATPLLFQGQEYGASTPFLYFADHNKDLAPQVQEGRGEFVAQFPSMAYSQIEFALGVPHDRATFERCKLDDSERQANTQMLELHRDLLRLRREDPVFSAQRSDWMHGAVLGPEAFVLRFFGQQHGDRLIVVNLGRDLRLRPAPEPLLAQPRSGPWEMLWSSEDPKYGGSGRPPVRRAGNWNIPGHCAVVMYERSSD